MWTWLKDRWLARRSTVDIAAEPAPVAAQPVRLRKILLDLQREYILLTGWEPTVIHVPAYMEQLLTDGLSLAAASTFRRDMTQLLGMRPVWDAARLSLQHGEARPKHLVRQHYLFRREPGDLPEIIGHTQPFGRPIQWAEQRPGDFVTCLILSLGRKPELLSWQMLGWQDGHEIGEHTVCCVTNIRAAEPSQPLQLPVGHPIAHLMRVAQSLDAVRSQVTVTLAAD